MPITFTCPHCQHRHNAPESFAGLACRCKCGNVVYVPDLAPESAASAGSIFDELTSADLERLKKPPQVAPVEVETKPVSGHSALAASYLERAAASTSKRKTESGWSGMFKIALALLGCLALFMFAVLVLVAALVHQLGQNDLSFVAVEGSPDVAQSPVEARRGFQTQIVRQMAPPESVPTPPPGLFRIVRYDSPVGKLAAYLTPDPRDGQKHPAIIWITGGDCNSIGDVWEDAPPENDQTASAFRKAGIVTLFPSLRGGNDNPGTREFCLGEIDDICAAAEFLATQTFVDADRIYLGGHSTGGSLALLTAASSNKFRAVFSFGPVGNVGVYGPDYLPFDLTAQRELELRAPIRWLHSIQCPTFVFEGARIPSNAASVRAMSRATKNPAVHVHLVPGTDHFSILAPVTRLIATKILSDSGPATNLDISDADLRLLTTR